MSKYEIATRTLPDGREASVHLMTYGKARIYVCRGFSVEAEY